MFKFTIFLVSSVISSVIGRNVQENFKNQSVGEYHLDKGWPSKFISDLDVKGSSISIDSSGNIVLLHRGFQGGSKTTRMITHQNMVAIIDRNTGKFLKQWGNNFIQPHGLFITQNGDIFVTDTVMHQVFKFELDNSTKLWKNEPSLALGEPFVAGFEPSHFCGPADVIEDPETGDFFVADGYCHSRVIKFDRNGKHILQFGAGSSNMLIPPVPFSVPHGLALAQRIKNSNSTHELQTILLVADRNNSRIQVFNLNGTFLYEIGSSDLNSEGAMILSMATTVSSSKNFEFGEVFVIKGHVPLGEAKVIMIGLHEKNFTIISSFPITKLQLSKDKTNVTSSKDIKLETPHDIALVKNGKEIYIVEAVPRLTLKRFLWTENKPQPIKGETGSGKAIAPNITVSKCLIIIIMSLILIFVVQ